MKALSTSAWPSALIVVAVVVAAAVLAALHDAVPVWFELVAGGALGHAFTVSGVNVGSSTLSGSSSPPPPPGARS